MDNLEITDVEVVLDLYQSGELVAMLAEFKVAINDYLKELITSPVRSLAEVIAFNTNNPDLVRNCPSHSLTSCETRTNALIKPGNKKFLLVILLTSICISCSFRYQFCRTL